MNLTPELERIISTRVASGLYSDASEVMREALRCLLAREEAERLALADLRAAVAVGAAEAERGEFAGETLSDIAARMEARHSG